MKKDLDLNYLIYEDHAPDNTVTRSKTYFKDMSNIIMLDSPFAVMEQYRNTDGIMTLEYIDERIANKRLILNYDMLSDNQTMHSHDYFEFMLVLDGVVELNIEGEKFSYNRGDVCVLNRNVKHLDCFLTDQHVAFVCVSKNFLQSWPKEERSMLKRMGALCRFFFDNIEGNEAGKKYIHYTTVYPITGDTQEVFPLKYIFHYLKESLRTPLPGSSLIARGLITRFMYFMEDKSFYRSSYIDLGNIPDEDIADAVKHYIEQKKGRVTRDELAAVLNYNGDYLNRVFKKNTGISVKSYSQKIYMKEAERLVRETSFSFEIIAEYLGFNSRSQFYQLFSQYFNKTPKEYRLEYTPLSVTPKEAK